jgi:phosphosulfolactate synthase (CoM biosynthesis protein A)
LPILEKVDKHIFDDITDEEYNILTSFIGVYKVNDRRSLKETVMMFIECFGNDCNLNWINTSNITNMDTLFEDSEFTGDIS